MAIQLTGAMRQNLFALQNTNDLMDITQRRLSTGLKVETALDDPINFFAAQEHNNRADDLSFRKDAMGEAIQTIKAANNGIEAITELIASAKSTAQSALSAGDTTEQANLATQFNSLMDQIDGLAADSGYKGINFLENGTLTVSFNQDKGINFLENGTLTVSFNQDGSNAIGLSGFDGCASGLGIADATNSWANTADIDAAITDLDNQRVGKQPQHHHRKTEFYG